MEPTFSEQDNAAVARDGTLAAPIPVPDAPRFTLSAKAAFIFTGVILPVICFLIGYPDQPDWQAGTIAAYAKLLLSKKASWPIYPLLLYNMVCMVLMRWRPGHYAKFFVVRFGIYSGALLAFQYWVTFQLTMADFRAEEVWKILGGAPLCIGLSLVGLAVPWFLFWAFFALARRFGVAQVVSVALVILFPLCLLIGLAAGDPSSVIMVVPVAAIFISLFFSTTWALAAYAVMSVYAARYSGVKRFRYGLDRLLAIFVWWAGYLGAWRMAFLLMLAEYAKLPETQPSRCYIATAAARGHRRLVGSRPCRLPDGQMAWINDQMRHLKAAEFLLLAVSPGTHRACRRVYDRLGPWLSSWLVHPLLADLAYLSLKPAEWLARAAVAAVVGKSRSHLPSGTCRES